MQKKQLIFSWQKKIVFIICTSILITGCSRSSGSKEQSQTASEPFNALSGSMDADTSFEEDMYEVSESESMAQSEDKLMEDASASGQAGQEAQTVSREMLVYRGMLTIDTLHFNQSVTAFKTQIEEAGGFIETETFSDDADIYDYYAVEESEKHNLFTATVRIPSSQYHTVMDSAGDIGDLRSKQSNAENVTQQYGTYQSELQVYETEYKRYLELLKNAKKEKNALLLEEKIFDLQVTIADLKSSITNLETDVAYSYIDITIREVIAYQSEVEESDTFLHRLKETCSDSWVDFLSVLEGILFLLIHVWYYIVIALAAIFCVLHFNRQKRKKRTALKSTSRKTASLKSVDSSENADSHESIDSSKM